MISDGVGGSLEGVGRLSKGYGKVVWMVWRECLEGVGRLSDKWR